LECESVKSSATQIKTLLVRHIAKLNSIPIFQNSLKILIIENNLGNEASHMWNMVKNNRTVKAYWQKEDKIGIHKGKNTADDYRHMFTVKLYNDAILFDMEFFTCSSKHGVQAIKAIAREQLERYHYEYEAAKTIHQHPKQTITGKLGATENDDLAIAILMGVYWPNIVLKDVRNLR